MNRLPKPMWKECQSKVLLAAHRGCRFILPENTMPAFRYAIEAGVDMIETDVRMTKDGALVIMHDATVDRTTDGTGLIRDMTLAEFKALNAAYGYEDFPEGIAPPTLEEFLKLCSNYDNLLIDFELKEYPTPGDEAWAFDCCDKTIELLEKYGYADKCVLNSFSAPLLFYIDKKYNHRYRLHGYYPYQVPVGLDEKDLPAYKEMLYCLCLITRDYKPDGTYRNFNAHVPPKSFFDEVLKDGIEPAVCSGIYSEREILRCAELGASMITADYPETVLKILREHGLHE